MRDGRNEPGDQKLQFKDNGQPVLIVNPPEAYSGVIAEFQGPVHHHAESDQYDLFRYSQRPTQSCRL
ncbi:hypothetical protein PO124_02475 [Bacillus licheniformis]|nr:hypothetical protein [Bacillus licheniformis]